MRKTLSDHLYFKEEKSIIEHMLCERGHVPVERVWAQLKRFTKAHCKYSIQSLRKNIPLAYDSVTLENIFVKYDIICLDTWKALCQEKILIKHCSNTRKPSNHIDV